MLVRAHDGQHPLGLGRVGGVFGTALHVGRVVVDLPKVFGIAVLERPEVVFTMRVIVWREGVELPHLGDNRLVVSCWQAPHALGQHDGDAEEG